MSDRKNVNKYYPPDWDPSKGSLNTYHNSHPLRERAAKLKSHGILVIRFEMPFNIWCSHCNAHIGKGVRYNADKQKIGMYYSTPVFSFTMNCHLCGGKIVVHTAPDIGDYIIYSGGRRKIETYDAADAGVIELPDETHKEQIHTDVLHRLEHKQKDKQTAATANSHLASLLSRRAAHEDDFALNSLVRKQQRADRHNRQHEAAQNIKRGWAGSMTVVPQSKTDSLSASSIRFTRSHAAETDRRQRRQLVMLKHADPQTQHVLKTQMQRGVAPLTLLKIEAEEEKKEGTTRADPIITVKTKRKATDILAAASSSQKQPETRTHGDEDVEQKEASSSVIATGSCALQALVSYKSDSED